jgi:protein-S-isoprenylcysteine O-methyltransferase Ste14
VIVQVGLHAAVLFLAAGRLDWDEAWIFLGIHLVWLPVNFAFMMRLNPETVAERAGGGEGWKGWDKLVGILFFLVYYIGILATAGLDERYGWTGELGLSYNAAGVAIFVLGGALFSWAMIANAYFSTVVRIQEERGHAVCDKGPYRFVRHPGYVGAILQALGLPLLLDSTWAFVPGALAAVLLIVRTALEDSTLKEELAGYQAYTQRTRYRLLPGIW